jgi:distribution and morphology protein 31
MVLGLRLRVSHFTMSPRFNSDRCTTLPAGLTDAIAKQIYDALAYHVVVANRRLRIKTVGAWSLQKTAQAVLVAARHIVDPISAHLRVLYSMEGLYY